LNAMLQADTAETAKNTGASSASGDEDAGAPARCHSVLPTWEQEGSCPSDSPNGTGEEGLLGEGIGGRSRAVTRRRRRSVTRRRRRSKTGRKSVTRRRRRSKAGRRSVTRIRRATRSMTRRRRATYKELNDLDKKAEKEVMRWRPAPARPCPKDPQGREVCPCEEGCSIKECKMIGVLKPGQKKCGLGKYWKEKYPGKEW